MRLLSAPHYGKKWPLLSFPVGNIYSQYVQAKFVRARLVCLENKRKKSILICSEVLVRARLVYFTPLFFTVNCVMEKTRALHGSALENRRKWYGLGVPRFFKQCGMWYLSLRYLMVRLPTPRFFKWYLVTVSQHCGKQMARYMVTTFLRGRQMARYMVLRSINFLRGRQTARLR